VVPSWRVVSVHDGDTLRVIDRDNVEVKVRLLGIDAPETGQAFGTKSRDALAAMVKGKAVELVGSEKDRYGRTLATVMVGGVNANLEMVRKGLAWHFTRYSKDPQLAEAEREARAAKRGLWADAEPVAPWKWRAAETNR
jgi:endonuclease YncB( thermonuclease family)